MSFLKNIFRKKPEAIKTYDDFWIWFQQNEKEFHKIVKSGSNIEKGFFNKLSPKLAEIKEGFYFLAGMFDDNTAELILTADGNTQNIVFVEELVNAAPEIEGWKITAHKVPMNIENIEIKMGKYLFNRENINFYSNELPNYPDEIDVTVVHNDLNSENRSQVANGTYIFLDNYLGELDFLTNIDNLTIIGKDEATKQLVPIAKLKDFLKWRQKEFIEKYDGVRYDTDNDEYSILEAELESGNMSIAVINTELLKWDRKASHPWVSILTFKYDGSKNNGMPNESDYQLLNSIEEDIMQILKDKDGYLNVGRLTSDGERDIMFACNDFRKPSKIFYEIQLKYSSNFEIDFEIYKDKYWQSFKRFSK